MLQATPTFVNHDVCLICSVFVQVIVALLLVEPEAPELKNLSVLADDGPRASAANVERLRMATKNTNQRGSVMPSSEMKSWAKCRSTGWLKFRAVSPAKVENDAAY